MRIERTSEVAFNAASRFGHLRVSDQGGYRTYYVDKCVPDALKLALSLIGVDIAKPQSESMQPDEISRQGFGVNLVINDTRLAIHTPPGLTRTRIEVALDEIFGIPQSDWRKP
jgi:hypothetical protein